MHILHMKSEFLIALLITVASSVYAAPPAKLSDAQLREKIVGVWFSEELPNLMKHIATRMQYFPDGRFIGDYRISGPGSEQYLRSVGRWKVSGGEFSETAEKTSDPAISFPIFVRHVVAIDPNHMILETSDGTRAELWRGKMPLETGARSVSSLDRKKLFSALLSMHVSGYRSVPDGGGNVSSRLDSRKIEKPPHQ